MCPWGLAHLSPRVTEMENEAGRDVRPVSAPLIGPHVLRLPRCSSPEAMLSLIGRLGCHSDLVWGLPFPEVMLALIGPLVVRLLCCEVPPFT